MNTQNNPRDKRQMFKTHWEMRTKSECGGNRASVNTKSDLDYAPRIMGTLNQNFPSFSKNLGRNQILKIETTVKGKWPKNKNEVKSRT
jgi:hypothetical protein